MSKIIKTTAAGGAGFWPDCFLNGLGKPNGFGLRRWFIRGQRIDLSGPIRQPGSGPSRSPEH